MQSLRDHDFDLELKFLRNPYIYVFSTCMQKIYKHGSTETMVKPNFYMKLNVKLGNQFNP